MIGDHAIGLDEELAKLAQELSGCYEELALLHGLMDRLRPFTDAQRVVRTVLEMVAEALRVRYAFVLLLDNDGPSCRSSRLLWVESSDGARRGFVHGRRLRVHAYDGITRHALETGRPLIVNDVTADARFCPYPMPIRRPPRRRGRPGRPSRRPRRRRAPRRPISPAPPWSGCAGPGGRSRASPPNRPKIRRRHR